MHGAFKSRGVLETIFSHRSIRKYKPEPIPEDHLELILQAGRRAPTDATLHLWTAIRVTDKQLRSRIAGLIGQKHVEEAAEFLVFVGDMYRTRRLLEYRGVEPGKHDCALLLFAAIDAAIAAENMALAAESLGYGTCFIGGVMDAALEIARLLHIPEKAVPLFGLTIGVPDEDPPLRPRMPLDILVHENKYRRYTSEDLRRVYEELAPYSRKRDWLRLLRRYAARGGYFEEREMDLPELFASQGIDLSTVCSKIIADPHR